MEKFWSTLKISSFFSLIDYSETLMISFFFILSFYLSLSLSLSLSLFLSHSNSWHILSSWSFWIKLILYSCNFIIYWTKLRIRKEEEEEKSSYFQLYYYEWLHFSGLIIIIIIIQLNTIKLINSTIYFHRRNKKKTQN